MAALSPNKIAWRYVADATTNYVLPAQKAITDQLKTGGQAADGTETSPPAGFKYRRVNCQDAAGHKRSIIAYDTACDLWTTNGTTLNLNYLNNSTVFTGKGPKSRREQSWPRRSIIADAS